MAVFTAAFVIASAVFLALPAIEPGLATFWERTVESQLDRSSPFSIWGQVDGIEWAQKAVLIAAGLLAVAVAFVPRRRSVAQIAALAAAVLIALQLAVDHWFYLYIPWFLGPVLIALCDLGTLGYGRSDETRGPGFGVDPPARLRRDGLAGRSGSRTWR